MPRPPGPRGSTVGHYRPTTSRLDRLPDPPATVPKPPAKIPGWARADWRELWASPVAGAWSTAELDAVGRLAVMRAMVRRELVTGGKVATGLLAEVRHLEDVLLLTPRSRRLVGLPVLAVEEPPTPAAKLTLVGVRSAAGGRPDPRDLLEADEPR